MPELRPTVTIRVASTALALVYFIRLALHNQFQSELHLPRRSGFTRREARVGDPSEGRAADNIARLAKVRMVEEVEELGPELQAHSLAEPGVFDAPKNPCY